MSFFIRSNVLLLSEKISAFSFTILLHIEVAIPALEKTFFRFWKKSVKSLVKRE